MLWHAWLQELIAQLGRDVTPDEEFMARRLHKAGVPPTWAATKLLEPAPPPTPGGTRKYEPLGADQAVEIP